MTVEELKQRVKELEFTVKRRGYTIGGLYAALDVAMNNAASIYTIAVADDKVDITEFLKTQLEAAEKKRISDPNHNPVEELPKDFGCNICFETYNNGERKPVAMGCGHVSCNECMLKHAEKSASIQCPYCKKPIKTLLTLYL